jgi:hypothetical protein
MRICSIEYTITVRSLPELINNLYLILTYLRSYLEDCGRVLYDLYELCMVTDIVEKFPVCLHEPATQFYPEPV